MIPALPISIPKSGQTGGVSKRPVCPSSRPDETDSSTRKGARDGRVGTAGVFGGLLSPSRTVVFRKGGTPGSGSLVGAHRADGTLRNTDAEHFIESYLSRRNPPNF